MPSGRSRRGSAQYGGFFLSFEPMRTEKVAEYLHVYGEASESFSAMDWDWEQREVVLLALTPGEPHICGAALMQRMFGSGGTGKLKMRLTNPVLFEEPIEPQNIQDVASLSELQSSAERLKRIDPALWERLLAAIKRERPTHSGSLSALLALRQEPRRLLGDSARITRLTEQRDAVGLSLDIAGLDRGRVLKTLDMHRAGEAASILELLDAEPVHEQDLLRHDAGVFGELFEPSMRSARFTGPSGRGARIYVYDKKPLETVLGIDLLIYQEVYRSFVLVQYKAMKHVSGRHGMTWSYLVDATIREQLAAMEAAETSIAGIPSNPTGIWDWRLHSSPFYFKFCEATRPNARDESLVHGITLSVDQLRQFLALTDSDGEHGGKRVGYDNCARYFSNTQFVELAREGWIGCDARGSSFIVNVLRKSREGGKVAMLATIHGVALTDARGRGRRKESPV